MKHTEERGYFARVLLAGLLAAMFGCRMDQVRRDAEKIPASRTFALLQRYLKTADWRDRVAIAEASGDEEILASRIFAAFGSYVSARMNISKHGETDWLELKRNPQLTLAYLRPVVDEAPGLPAEDWNRYIEQSDTHRDCPPAGGENVLSYISVCSRLAETEDDGRARSMLQSLCTHSNRQVAESAHHALAFLETYSITPKSRSFLEKGMWDDLSWISGYYLHEGMSRDKIESLIGQGSPESDWEVIYQANGCHPQLCASLELIYCDNRLESWRWLPDRLTP